MLRIWFTGLQFIEIHWNLNQEMKKELFNLLWFRCAKRLRFVCPHGLAEYTMIWLANDPQVHTWTTCHFIVLVLIIMHIYNRDQTFAFWNLTMTSCCHRRKHSTKYNKTDETNNIPTPVTIVTITYVKGTCANPTVQTFNSQNNWLGFLGAG